MNTPTFKTRLPILALLVCGAFAAVPAWAVPVTDRAELAELAARHKQERADCLNVQEAEARADCVRDANVAYGHAKRNRASTIDPPFAKNATARCDALPAADRRDCLARMDGKGTTSGSVAGGGIYRELVVIEAAAVPTPAASTTPASTTPASTTPAPTMPTPPQTTPMSPTTSTTMPMAPAPTAMPATPAAPASAVPPSATNPTTPK